MRILATAFGALLAVQIALASGTAPAADAPGVIEHPMVQRYPGQEIRWQTIENFRPYRIPIGPVTGYKTIGDWVETEGRVTRTFYARPGSDRSFEEVFANFREAFAAAGFDIRAAGQSASRGGTAVGGRQWLGIYLEANPFAAPGEVGTIAAGTASQGGAGSFVAYKDRAAGPVWVVVTVEQHAADYVGTLVDIVEVERAEIGLVAIDAEAVGRDLSEKGRVVLDGLHFDFDSATLQLQSAPTLAVIAGYLKAHAEQRFYVVGHTDAKGGFDYNQRLSTARAAAVVAALQRDYGIAGAQLSAHGVGPLVPVFSNASNVGRERNRRVELVEQR